MTNYEALLTLIGDINNAFCHLEEEDVADICDGDINNAFCHLEEEDVAAVCDADIRLLDKAVKRFKKTIWENQLD